MSEDKLPAFIMPENMILISDGLLEDIRLELACISKWYAFESTNNINLENGYTIINNEEFLVQLDFEDLIKRIDKVLK